MSEQVVPVVDRVAASHADEWEQLVARVADVGGETAQAQRQPREGDRDSEVLALAKKKKRHDERSCDLGEAPTRDLEQLAEGAEQDVPGLVHAECQPGEDRPVFGIGERADAYVYEIGKQERSPDPAASRAPLERIVLPRKRAQLGIPVMNVSERRRRTTLVSPT